MKLFQIGLICLISLIWLTAKSIFAASFPAPTGFVNDFANVLTTEQRQTLETNLSNFEKQTGNEVSVAIIKELGGDTIENVAVKIFEEWKIGKKGQDNGVLLLVTIDDRKLKIETGYGIEPKLTDGKAGEIIRNIIAPKFKQNDYFGGISDGLTAIEKIITEPIKVDPKISLSPLWWFLIPLIIYLAAFLGRSKTIWPGGLIGLIIGIFLAGLTGALIAGLVGLFLDWILSRNYKKLKTVGKSTGFWASGGGFSSGSGFGEFGGGSSGGGGASGDW